MASLISTSGASDVVDAPHQPVHAIVPRSIAFDPLLELRDAVARCRSFSVRRGSCIGRGSCSAVYEGLVENTGQLVAMKEIAFRRSDIQTVRFLLRELLLLRALKNAYIAPFLGAELVDPDGLPPAPTSAADAHPNFAPHHITLRIFTERVGTDISKLLQTFNKLPFQLVQRFTRHAVGAALHLHNRGIVHRDIKPANLLLDTSTGIVKLADFGSAKDWGVEGLEGNDAPTMGAAASGASIVVHEAPTARPVQGGGADTAGSSGGGDAGAGILDAGPAFLQRHAGFETAVSALQASAASATHAQRLATS